MTDTTMIAACAALLFFATGLVHASGYSPSELVAHPNASHNLTRLLVCGDGAPDPGEECDDGNLVNGDGCSASCQIEAPIECYPQPGVGFDNALADGSFEDGNAGGEWTAINHSLFGPNLVCDDSCFGAPFAAGPGGGLVSGNYVLISGGSFAEPSTGNVTHAPVAIPAAATALGFFWATLASGPAGDACAGPGDGLSLSMGGIEVWSSTDAGPCTNVNPYEEVVIDLASAPGGPYQGTTVDFEFTAGASGIPPNIDLTNIMLDEVSIRIPTEPPPPDCELDGVPDWSDNCWLTPNGDQRDTDGDGHGNVCDADLNQDCIVNTVDLGLFRLVYFGADPNADLNGDGAVNSVDLGLFKSLYLRVPGPSAAGSLCNP